MATFKFDDEIPAFSGSRLVLALLFATGADTMLLAAEATVAWLHMRGQSEVRMDCQLVVHRVSCSKILAVLMWRPKLLGLWS